MPSVAASGSQTATLDTDHTLASQVAPTGGAAYFLRVDTSALAIGETLVLKLQSKARTSDSTVTVYESTHQHEQTEALKVSPLVILEAGNTVVAVLRQEGGTGRAFPWALVEAT